MGHTVNLTTAPVEAVDLHGLAGQVRPAPALLVLRLHADAPQNFLLSQAPLLMNSLQLLLFLLVEPGLLDEAKAWRLNVVGIIYPV